MPTLIFRSPDGEELEQELEQELTVGRGEGNDVVLAGQGISRKHCRFFSDGQGEVWVEDLGSSNGTFVAGSRIEEAACVAPGDEVAIGDWIAELAEADGGATDVGRGGRGAKAPSPRSPPRKEIVQAPPRRPTRAVREDEEPRRAAPVPKAKGPAGAPRDGKPRLCGSGAFADVAMALDRPKLLVGRVAPADLQIDDDSVSRRHAEICKVGSRFVVRDLGSANGTFINGKRASEGPLAPGDTVRFGVVEFQLQGPPGAKAAPAGGKRRAVLLVALAVGLIVVGALLFQGGEEQAPSRRQAIGQPAEKGGEDVAKLMGQCRAYADPDSDSSNWEAAARTCARVAELDPLMPDARALAKKAKREVEAEGRLADATRKLSTTQEEEALKILVGIEKDSSVFPRAAVKFREAAGLLNKRARTACRSGVNTGDWESAEAACRKVLELTCNTPEGPDAEVAKAFATASRAIGRGKGEYRCPPEYAPFQATVTLQDDSGARVQKALRAKYSDPAVFALMLGYYERGRPKQVADELKRMRSRRPRDRAALGQLIQDLEIVDGRWATAQGLIRDRRPFECLAHLQEAFDADRRLVGSEPGLKSAPMKDMSVELSRLFFDVAKEEIAKDRHDKAFKAAYEAYKLDATNTDLTGLIAKMDRVAGRKLTEEPSCETFAYAASITAPDSHTHKRALDLARTEGCQAE